MGPSPNVAQRKFRWAIRLSLFLKIAAFLGLLLFLKHFGVW